MKPEESVDLIKKAKKGDKFAFGILYKEYMPRIFRYILYLISDKEQAEDLTQETFLKAWKYLPKFRSKKGTFQAFIYRIARNLVIDYQRKKKAKVMEPEFTSRIESSDNVEEKVVRKEKKEEVLQALEKLPDFDRELIILRYFEELSFKEIAKTVKKKEGTIRVRVHRVLATLKENF